jgi:spore maturation protein CgeB
MKYDYGRREQGHSFEHCTFYDSLVHMGQDIIYFDFVSLLQEHGREWMNRRLAEVARTEKPDLLFSVLWQGELDNAVVRDISDNSDTVTVNWFCDDQKRFESFSRHWAPYFNWVVTTAADAPDKYARIGHQHTIKSQWACNHFSYRKLDLPLVHDVTFVGLPHGDRRQVLERLRRAGLDADAWGQGWEAGRLSQEEMIRVFNQSRVNLCLNNDRTPILPLGKRVKRLLRRSAQWVLARVPLGHQLQPAGLRAFGLARDTTLGLAARMGHEPRPKFIEQIKGRNFEVPGCGGFLLSGRAENIEQFYEDGKEIVCYDDEADLVAKARYYLEHEEERAAIALAGYERTLREHTYVHRFVEILGKMGLPAPDLNAALAGRLHLGATLEVT